MTAFAVIEKHSFWYSTVNHKSKLHREAREHP